MSPLQVALVTCSSCWPHHQYQAALLHAQHAPSSCQWCRLYASGVAWPPANGFHRNLQRGALGFRGIFMADFTGNESLLTRMLWTKERTSKQENQRKGGGLWTFFPEYILTSFTCFPSWIKVKHLFNFIKPMFDYVLLPPYTFSELDQEHDLLWTVDLLQLALVWKGPPREATHRAARAAGSPSSYLGDELNLAPSSCIQLRPLSWRVQALGVIKSSKAHRNVCFNMF